MGIVHTRMLSPCADYGGLPFSNKPVLATSDIRSQNCQLDLLFFFVM
jgi:hypothetical protein